MNYVNIRTACIVKLEIELESIQSGERRLGVSNQFDEYVIQSALANISQETFDQTISELTDPYSIVNFNVMSIADYFSTMQIEEPSASWFN